MGVVSSSFSSFSPSTAPPVGATFAPAPFFSLIVSTSSAIGRCVLASCTYSEPAAAAVPPSETRDDQADHLARSVTFQKDGHSSCGGPVVVWYLYRA